MIEYYASSARVNSYQDPWLVGEGLITSGSVSVPSLDLNFITDGVSPLVTFSRGSNATQFDSTGSLVYAPANLLLRSQAFATSPWASGGLTSITNNTTDVTDPAGTNTATKLVVAGSAGLVGQNVVLSSINQTGSVWLRCASGTVTGSLILFLSIAPGTVIGFQSITITTTWQRFTFNTSQLPINGNTYTFNVQNLSGGTVYAWGAQLNPTPMVGGVTASLSTYYPTVASAYYGPRLDYNPTTLASQGLLIEEQRTNSIRNNTMQGAVAGTPGTLPTNWSISTTGATTYQVIGTGTESGITYVDLRIQGSGAADGWNIIYDSSVVAANGQAWTGSIYLKLSAGSTANLPFIQRLVFRDSGFANIQQLDSAALTPTGAGLATQRNTISLTATQATTAFVTLQLNSGAPTGAYNITLRIGLPQLEQGAFATSVIPTTTAAATRSADVASVNTLTPWYNATEGTLYAQGKIEGGTTATFPYMAALVGANANTDAIGILWRANNLEMRGAISVAGVSSFDQPAGLAKSAGSSFSSAIVYATNNCNFATDGFIGADDTSVTLPTIQALSIGGAVRFQPVTSAWLRRITYYPRRLSNAELQAITS